MANLALVFDIIGKDHASKAFDDVSKSADDAGKKAGGFGAAFKGSIAGLGAAVAAAGVVDFMRDTIGAASDLNETVNKANVIFGKNASAINKWADTAATKMGMSKGAALDAAAGFGDMFSQIGFSGDAAADMSKKVVQMSADLGSFNNLGTEDVADKISAAFRGEYDSLQALIPNINAARVEQVAMEMTGAKSAKTLTAQQKAAAVLAIVQKDGARAMGDFGNTSDGVANSQKILAAQLEDTKAKIGTKLQPVMQKAFGFINTVAIPAIEKLTEFFTENSDIIIILAGVVGTLVAGMKIYSVTMAIVNAVTAANPFVLVAVLLAALATGFVIAYQRSETFRTIVQAAWKGVQDGATFMWEKVLKPTFKFLVTAWVTVAGAILSGAATAFGWVPGLGPKLQEASKKFDQFKADVNKALGGIDDEPVTVSVGFKYGGPTTSKYKKPLYYMGDGYGLDSYGKGIGDGPGLDVKSVFPSMSSISTNSRNSAMAGGLDQLMSMYEDSGSSGAPAGAMKWQALWAAVRAAVPGATLNSSFRKNAITATGNRSYHSMGRAIDIGPATMGTFRIVKALFPHATELIFSPAGKQQLWHGQPHMYSGVTRANHWDHVHLAMQQGGLVPGYGRGDKIPALLEPGEYVVSRPQVQRQGVASLDAMNSGAMPPGITNIYNGDIYDYSLIERQRRQAVAEQRAANFRAGVTA